MLQQKTLKTKTHCYHCGDDLPVNLYLYDDKQFCCLGCKGVYQILSNHNLDNYYAYNDVPGQSQKVQSKHFEYLDEPEIVAKLVDYTDEKITTITLYIPAIHCSSCIWLLENLYKINPAIAQSRIDFLKKQVAVTFKNEQTSLRSVVEILVSIGYEPLISLQDVVKKQQANFSERTLVTKIAVAGFCFGNVMLLSFPEYFGLSDLEQQFKSFFGWLNMVFAVPIVLYCGKDYFISAYNNLKRGVLNLDFPLALGIAVMFIRSLAEIASNTGAGFVDTLCGLVFFLLIGKWMQQRTYHHLSFERDYRSYFPVAVTLIKDGKEKPVPLNELSLGNRMLIRSNEIIPADAILLKGEAEIDFSFVTGESLPVKKTLGEVVYAGGRQLLGAIELEVVKPVSQSYLTGLWNNEAFFADKNRIKTFSDTASKYFSVLLLLIAIGSAAFWMLYDGNATKAVASFTAVLIIACPCALALSTPFTLAAVLSIFDRNKFYLKSTAVVEELARIDTFVFDKTGTITNPEAAGFNFEGNITEQEKQLLSDLARNSGHPLSRELVKLLNISKVYPVDEYVEKIGRGISGTINGNKVKLGGSTFLGLPLIISPMNSSVHVMINDQYLGYFTFKQQWREGFKDLTFKLSKQADLHLLSGDQDHDKQTLIPFFPRAQQMQFGQSPQNKLDYIKKLQNSGKKVLMFGDGLNDAGALRQSNLGVAVTDNINNFSPDCDAILDGAAFHQIPQFIQQAKDAVKIIHISFIISLLYNTLGLYFAIQGLLSPLIAAILMPISTITIISFTSIAARLYARKNKLL
ncbi:MAG: heavy metal translocating P-type ATPase metal-binding domain-containing protein [Candidatus Pedobacter colombiensis]|uniref:Heavy metal translocating P-type ATPase metal-binding domain-containing protein n=1 Tax=Candidatus Pedobacter colombiensis TaxID=3121371 RepID=A0AAJ6B6Y7_9SPHI|nr:heavy metal translocating P-type ATPase metal-binding domain-containing protein [Pedobacter sp.]WEK17508.1 MAG: heavy metal translocating P-type ATPase metal-binding domain-containing protein [Pedobacter sp.]